MTKGTVVAAHGRQYVVVLDDQRRLHCFPRGKKSEIACGDDVEISMPSADQGCIESIVPRHSLLYRSNEFKEKLIAANLTQVVIVVACDPPFSEQLLSRCLIAAEDQGLKSLIVLNKVDLESSRADAESRIEPFERLGYRVMRLCANRDVESLRSALGGERNVLVGQSGMGKSTITNALVPEAMAATREISQALRTGKHTTTHATLYTLDHPLGGWVIDSPGLQEFGLHQLDQQRVEQAMPELRGLPERCRFRNCRHDREPDCAVRAALTAGAITPARFEVYRALVDAITPTRQTPLR